MLRHRHADRCCTAPTSSGKTTIFDLAFLRLQEQWGPTSKNAPLAIYMAPTKVGFPWNGLGVAEYTLRHSAMKGRKTGKNECNMSDGNVSETSM